jgi:hypothetical protein
MEKMTFGQLILGVLKTPEVIFITVLMILFVAIANYVQHYVKKIKPSKKKKAAPPPPPPKKEEGEDEEGGGDEE